MCIYQIHRMAYFDDNMLALGNFFVGMYFYSFNKMLKKYETPYNYIQRGNNSLLTRDALFYFLLRSIIQVVQKTR